MDPGPGVDADQIESYFDGRGDQILGLLNLFSGGALSQSSLFALGIMPYVTASIILQLLTVVIPRLAELQKEGEAGDAKITQYTLFLTIVLAAAQAIGYAFLFRSQGALQAGSGELALIIVTLTAGTALLMWMGQLITKRGIGNGTPSSSSPRSSSAPRSDRRLVDGRPDGEALLPAHRDRDRRGGRLRAGGPAADPIQYAKRMVGRRITRGRLHLPPATREHGRRHPDHLRRGDPRLPADDGAVLPATRDFVNEYFQPGDRIYLSIQGFMTSSSSTSTRRSSSTRSPGREPAPPRRVHPGHPPGSADRAVPRPVRSRLTLPGSLFLALVATLPSLSIAYGGFSQARAGALGGTRSLSRSAWR